MREKPQNQATVSHEYSLKELSAAFPAPPVALPTTTWVTTTHLQASDR